MKTIEFNTIVKDGVIHLPPEYKGKKEMRVRVIIVAEGDESLRRDLIAQLLEKPVRVKGFRPLKREEIYGR